MYHPGVIRNPTGTYSACGSLPVEICEFKRGVYNPKVHNHIGDAQKDAVIARLMLVMDYWKIISDLPEKRQVDCIYNWYYEGW